MNEADPGAPLDQARLGRARLLALLDELDADPCEYLTLYFGPATLSAKREKLSAGLPRSGLAVDEALMREEVERETERFGTGAAVFWSEQGSRLVVAPPFAVNATAVEPGRPLTAPLREALERERVVGIVLINWGTYALGVFRGTGPLEERQGTGWLHQAHKKGGQSQKRFARRTENQRAAFLRRVAEHVDEMFAPHRPERVFLGGNRLALRPLVEESAYLSAAPERVSPRFLDARQPNRAMLPHSLEEAYQSSVFRFGVRDGSPTP